MHEGMVAALRRLRYSWLAIQFHGPGLDEKKSYGITSSLPKFLCMCQAFV